MDRPKRRVLRARWVASAVWFLLFSALVTGSTSVLGQAASTLSVTQQHGAGSLEIHRLDPQRIYSLTPDGRFTRSEDGGETWLEVPAPRGEGFWASLAVWQEDAFRIAASTRRGSVALSVDGGETFGVRSRQEVDPTANLAFDPDDPWTLYADGAQGVLRSDDGGVTWVPIWQGGFTRFAMKRSKNGADKRWVATCRSSGDTPGICQAVDLTMQSQDGAWEGIGTCELLRELDQEVQQKLRDAAALQPPTRPIHRLQLDGDLWLSTWAGLYRIPSHGGSCHRIRGLWETLRVGRGPGSGRDLWAISPDGLYRIDDRLRARRFSVPGESPLSSAASSPYGLYAQRSDASVLGFLGREGWQWLQRPLAPNTGLHLEKRPKTVTAPSTGEPRPPGDPLLGLHLDNHVGAVLLHPNDSNRIYAGSLRGLFVTEDGGQTWADRSEGLMPAEVHALAYDRQHQRLWAGTHGGGVYVSRDDGRTWQRRSIGLLGGAVQSLWIHPEDPRWMVATVSRRAHVSRDGGERWRPIGSRVGQPLGPVRQALLWSEAPGDETILALPWGFGPKLYGDAETTPELVEDLLACAPLRPQVPGPIQPRRMLWDPSAGQLHMATDKGMWSLAWDVEEHPAQPCGDWRLWPGQLNLQDIDLSDEGGIYGASSQGLWALSDTRTLGEAEGASWQRLDLPDPDRPVYSVDVGDGAVPVVVAGSDRGGVLVSHDGGRQWSLHTLPQPVPADRLREIWGSGGLSLPEVRLLPDGAEAAKKIEQHLESLPPSAHRDTLRWRLERFGLLGEAVDTALDGAAEAVRGDAASQIRRTGARRLWLAPSGEWLLASYVFDDGDGTRQDMRLFDLTGMEWHRSDTHLKYGASRRWQAEHDLDREPTHLLPRWQWNDSGELLAASPKMRAVVTWTHDDEVILWSLRLGEGAAPPVVDDGAVARPIRHVLARRTGARRPSVRFSPDGRRLALLQATDEGPGSLKIWRLREDERHRHLVVESFPLETMEQRGAIRHVAWHPSAYRLAAATTAGEFLDINLDEIEATVTVRSVPWTGGPLNLLTWSPDGSRLAALADAEPKDGHSDLWIWRTEAGGRLIDPGVRLASGVFGPLQMDATGRWLAARRKADRGLSLWDLSGATASEVPDLGPMRALRAFLDENRLLVERLNERAGDLEIWRLDPGPQVLEVLSGPQHRAATTSIIHLGDPSRYRFFTGAKEGRNPRLDDRWIELEKLPGVGRSFTFRNSTLVIGESGGQLDLWNLEGDIHRARVQIGRYDRAHDEARSLQDAFVDLFAMLPEIAWEAMSLEEQRRRFCTLAGGGPSRAEWRRVLPDTPYRPWCGPPTPPSGR